MTALALAVTALCFATMILAMRIRAGGGWAALRAAWTGEPACPGCRVPMIRLDSRPFPPRTYQVWVCLRCTNALAVPAAGGVELAECPACRQRALLTPIWRLPATAGGEPQVQVHESCPLCSHHASEDLPDVDREPDLAEVIPFPKPRQAPE